MDYVAVDLGASSTRYTTVGNKINFIPNNVFFVENMGEQLDNSRNGDQHENNLDVSIWKENDSEKKFFPMRALVGSMASRFGAYNVRPEQQRNKYEQRINYLSTVLAIALSKLKNPELSDKINLFSALPPSEVEHHKDEFKHNLVGSYVVKFNKIGPTDGTTIQFTINDVFCFEESRMATVQFLMDEAHPNRLDEYGSSMLMSIDIGASTTDLAIFENGSYIERTGRTYRIGGNTVRDLIIKAINAEYGQELSLSEADRCLAEGRMKYGNKYNDIGPIVESSKGRVAQQIISKLDNYFSGIEMSLMSINYIIVSGGGSMESSYFDESGKKIVTSQPMSEYITKALKGICDGVEVVFFGDEPRTANIRGLGMYAAVCDGEAIE